MMKFSWTGLFLVTGCSSLLFCLALKILDGDYPRLLMLIGPVSIVLGLLNWAGQMLARHSGTGRKKKNSSFPLSGS